MDSQAPVDVAVIKRLERNVRGLRAGVIVLSGMVVILFAMLMLVDTRAEEERNELQKVQLKLDRLQTDRVTGLEKRLSTLESARPAP